MSQRNFGDSIGLSNSGISNIENGIRNVNEQHIRLIRSEFNVNEDWLRHGTDEMFTQADTFSLDACARKNNLTELGTKIMKDCMELDPDMRKKIMSYFKGLFSHQEETLKQDFDVDAKVGAEKRNLKMRR